MKNPFDSGYYDSQTLNSFGFNDVGKNVFIAKNATIIGLENIQIADNVRIDSYSMLMAKNGKLSIGSNVHLAAYCYVAASCGVEIMDYCGLSQRVSIYTTSDDYSGFTLTNPTIPEKYKNLKQGMVRLEPHVIVGSGSVILPGVTIESGTAVGALSLVHKSLPSWSIYFGIPARKLRNRSQSLLGLAAKFECAGEKEDQI